MWKISKNKVPDSKRFSNLVNDWDVCYLCKGIATEKHEVYNGGGYRDTSKRYGLVVPLCVSCHRKVHNNASLRKNMKAKVQVIFEREFSHEEYMRLFKKNYV